MKTQTEPRGNGAGELVMDRIKDWAQVPTDINQLRDWAHVRVTAVEIKAKSGVEVRAKQLSFW